MSIYNTRQRQQYNQDNQPAPMYKWVIFVTLASFVAVFISLFVISLVSLLQTIDAFQELNDPNLSIVGIRIGLTLSVMYGLGCQYGQNVTLFIRQYYLSSRPLFTFYFRKRSRMVTAKHIAMFVFFITAFVDALTNIVWFYRNVQTVGEPVIDAMVFGIGYPLMVLSVFAEEVLGLVWQGLRRSWNDFWYVISEEKRLKIESKKMGRRYNPEPLQDQSQPQASVPPVRPTYAPTYGPVKPVIQRGFSGQYKPPQGNFHIPDLNEPHYEDDEDDGGYQH